MAEMFGRVRAAIADSFLLQWGSVVSLWLEVPVEVQENAWGATTYLKPRGVPHLLNGSPLKKPCLQ